MLGAPAVIPVSAVLELYNPEFDQLSADELTGLGEDSVRSQLAAFTFPASFKTEKQIILCYTSSKRRLGGMLLPTLKLTEEQPEIALFMHK